MAKEKTVWLKKDTAILLNKVKGIILQANPNIKATDDTAIKKALKFYQEQKVKK